MKVRFRETDLTADVVLRQDPTEGLVLAGAGNVFYPDGDLEDPEAEWIIWPEDFAEEWDLVEATDPERARLRAAGFRV
jgi:hypothetical protein